MPQVGSISRGSAKLLQSDLLERAVVLNHYPGADNTGVADSSTALSSAIAEVAAAGGGTIIVPPGVFLIDGITLSETVDLILHPQAKIAHASGSGTCITVEKNTSIRGGEFYRDSTSQTYTGTLIAVDSGAQVSRAAPIAIETALRCIGQHQGTGLLVEADGTGGDAYIQWCRFDVNCTSLEDAIRVYAHDGATNTVFINGNDFRIRAQNCDNVLNTEGYIGQSAIGGNDFWLRVQASSNSERVAILRAVTECNFYCDIYDWHAVAANAQPFYRPAGGSEHYNYRNKFYNCDFYDFLSNTTVGDMRLGGVDNQIVTNNYGGAPLLVDSSVANTNNKYFSPNAGHMKGHIWEDQADGKLHFSNGSAIETITSA